MTTDNTGPQEPNPWGQPPVPNPWGQPQQPPAPQHDVGRGPQQYPSQQPAQPQSAPGHPAPPYPQQPAGYPSPVPNPGPSNPNGAYPPPPTGAYPAGAPASAPGSPRKRKSLVPWIAGSAVALLLIVGGVVGFSLGSAAHAPELQVKSYLDALKKGDVAGAFEVSGTKVEKADLLLTKKAYAEASDRITRFTLGEVTIDDETATVTANITQGGEKYDHEFTLTKAGKDAVFFDKWQLEAPALSAIAVGANAPDDTIIEVAGVDISALEKEGDVYNLRALPGTYPVALGGDSDWYTAEELQATVIGFEANAEAADPQVLEIAMTEGGATAAADAVNTWLDACIASTELVPAGCPFWATNSQGYELSNIAWAVTKPTFTVGEFTDGGWPVVTDSEGSAQAAADARDPSNGATGRISTEQFPFDVDGVIEAFGEDGATFAFAG